jgi:hypothetical protein
MIITTPVLSIVDNTGSMLRNFKTWVNLVTDMAIIEGAGSPEGVVSARTTRQYMDKEGSAGNRLYIKTVDSVAGDNKNGWELV